MKSTEIDEIFATKKNKKSLTENLRDDKEEKESKVKSEKLRKPFKNDDQETEKICQQVKIAKSSIKSSKENSNQEAKSASKRNSSVLDDDLFNDPRGTKSKRRYTEDGLPIYSIEELVSQEGGDTELCPFDCKCCY
jgi:hypothetical protein